MSSAKRTPRYVERIPTNIQIVGPTVEAQVIPIRRVTPAYTPVIDAPPRPRARVVPVERRPWQVLVVSPMPGAPTRMVRVARWQARLAIGMLLVLLVATGGAVATLIIAMQSPDLFVASADAATLREQLLSMEDYLSVARDELAEANEATSEAEDSAAAATAALAKAMARPVPVRRATRKPSLTHAARLAARSAARAADPDAPALSSRSLEGLPVIGRLASTFSRARRHPILHITRPHLGVDVAAPRGTPVTAPGSGRVSFVGR
jgi:murein DD-endopeptidase MepM/ murein hydrolase activator NlpD